MPMKSGVYRQPSQDLLLDVRQTEYERRIPGAKLIPLPQLADSLSELDPEKPTIVY
jgi:rhodanese-related sulfurtransferase